jgi:uncharacterized protein
MYNLTPTEARVLGSLIEKELTTPEYYPLSLNALVNACNQKSNRDPHLTLDESAVEQALRSLEKQGFAGRADSDGRVTKYEHRLQEAFNFDRRDIAILCELLLRGPQTPGELRGRASRMHAFEDIAQVQSALQRLAQRDPSLVAQLSREPGTKESRYAQLMTGPVAHSAAASPASHSHAGPAASSAAPPPAPRETESSTLRDEIAALKSEIVSLKSDLADLRSQFAIFCKQFE